MEELFPPSDDQDKDQKDQEEGTSPDEDDEDSGMSGVLSVFDSALQSIREKIEEKKAENDEHRALLYGEEVFEDDDLNFGGDLQAYDRPAFTRVATDYSAYRYNLSAAGGTSTPGTTTTGYPSGGYSYGQGGYSGDSWTYTGANWSSSWYSGYGSVEDAIEGVHSHVSAFVTARGFTELEIVPNLEALSQESQACCLTNDDYTIDCTDGDLLVVRIDSSLYEKLGLSEAQQHYIVDGISQVLAAQSYPDPLLITTLHNVGLGRIMIPNVLREVITEMMRAKGLPILLDQMPGWIKRVNAFRSAMYIGAPKEPDYSAECLMYAIWERDAVETVEHEQAIKVIEAIEEILQKATPYPKAEGQATISKSSRARERTDAIMSIHNLLVDYLTTYSNAGEIVKRLTEMEKLAKSKLKKVQDCVLKMLHSAGSTKPKIKFGAKEEAEFWGKGRKMIDKSIQELRDLVHDHNRTFSHADGSILHQDHPAGGVVPVAKKSRIEFTRKCFFSFDRIPGEVCEKNEYAPAMQEFLDSLLAESIPSVSDKESVTHRLCTGEMRIKDLLDSFRKDECKALEAIEQALAQGKSGGMDSDATRRSGAKSINHEKFRSRGPISSGVDRGSDHGDAVFDSTVIIFDYTME